MSERLITYRRAGEQISLKPAAVRALVAAGRLSAVSQAVGGRGLRPRRFVVASSVDAYIRELRRAEAAAGAAPAVEQPRRRRSPSGVRAEVAAARQYV